jgi:hypothetical protein
VGFARDHIRRVCEIQVITVPVTTIDELLMHEKTHLSFIKLDLEGGEFCALLGARQLISKHHPIIVFENGLEWTRQYWDYTRDEFFHFFEEIGYDVFELFLRKLTPDEWRNPHRWPWDFIAVRKDNTDQARMKKIVHKFLLEAQQDRNN